MTTAVLAGSTGQCGSHMLQELLAQSSISAVYAYTRRDLPNPTASPKLFPLMSTDISTWPSQFPHELKPRIFLSGLATTRAQTGGVEGQRKIDVDMNYDLAKAAKDSGVETYVLISAQGANGKSTFAYPKMKGELEDKVKELGFRHTVILRPGMISGGRKGRGVAESALKGVAKGLGWVSPMLSDTWAQNADWIGKAAVRAGVMCAEGKKEPGIWEMGMGEIVALGKDKKSS